MLKADNYETCLTCHKTFKNEHIKQTHECFKCGRCGEVFQTYLTFNEHEVFIHKGQTCATYDQNFVNRSRCNEPNNIYTLYRQHVLDVHTAAKCSNCGDIFENTLDLAEHKAICLEPAT